MKTLHIDDHVIEGLRAFVVHPFDDTPSTVVLRLIDIAQKAQRRRCPFTLIQGEDDVECIIPSSTPIKWRIL